MSPNFGLQRVWASQFGTTYSSDPCTKIVLARIAELHAIKAEVIRIRQSAQVLPHGVAEVLAKDCHNGNETAVFHHV